MPPSEQITDLLDVLKNTRGSTISSNPPKSVTEGLGYALFVAGMQRDLPSLNPGTFSLKPFTRSPVLEK